MVSHEEAARAAGGLQAFRLLVVVASRNAGRRDGGDARRRPETGSSKRSACV
jgi:hypothetical protein